MLSYECILIGLCHLLLLIGFKGHKCSGDLALLVDKLDITADDLDDVNFQFVVRNQCIHFVLHVKLFHTFNNLCLLKR